jgi:hypothetical protein
LSQPAAHSFEVLPCAAAGSALEHVERRVNEVFAYSPDVIVVVFGHNLMLKYSTREWALRSRALLSHSRLLTGLFGITDGNHAWKPSRRNGRVRKFETWLRHLAGQAGDHGVTLAAITLTANLWFPPGISTPALRDPRFLAAVLDRVRGNRSAALQTLDPLAQRYDKAMVYFVEYWAHHDLAGLGAALADYMSGLMFASVLTPARRAGLLAGIADGFWEAGLRDEALAINALALREHAAESWIQLGLFRISDADETAATEAFQHALAEDPARSDAKFFLSQLAREAHP